MKTSKENAKAAFIWLGDVCIIYIPHRLHYAPSTGTNEYYRLFFLSCYSFCGPGEDWSDIPNSLARKSEYTLL